MLSRAGLDPAPPGFRVASDEPGAFLAKLAGEGVISVLVEGGPTLVGSFLAENALDELAIFVAPKVFGTGRPAFPAAAGEIDLSCGRFESLRRVGDDLWIGLRTAPGIETLSGIEEWSGAQVRRFA